MVGEEKGGYKACYNLAYARTPILRFNAMHYMYILKSAVDGNLYVGSTNDLKRRIQEHQVGKSFATSPRRPFTLVYYEAYGAEKDARRRESSLKLRGRARAQLISRLTESLRQA